MTLADIGRGQRVGEILADLDNPQRDESVDDLFRSARRNVRRHRQGSNDRLAQRRLAREAERAALETHAILTTTSTRTRGRGSWTESPRGGHAQERDVSLIRRAQRAAGLAAGLPVPAHYRWTLDNLSTATNSELEDACLAVELLHRIANLDCSDPEGR